MTYFDPIMKTTSPDLRPPALPGDVGFDLPASEGVSVAPQGFEIIPTGIHVELPPNHFGLILPKSSANIQGLLVKTGIIDCGYRGELLAIVHNLTHMRITIPRGRAVAQLVVLPMTVPKLKLVEELSDSERGENGFGSTSGLEPQSMARAGGGVGFDGKQTDRLIEGDCPRCRRPFTSTARSYPPRGEESGQCPSCYKYGMPMV